MAIKIDDLIPLLESGWVAMDYTGEWYWFENKPKIIDGLWRNDFKPKFIDGVWRGEFRCQHLNECALGIEPVKDWKNSLRKVG